MRITSTVGVVAATSTRTDMDTDVARRQYLKVTIICRYIFLWIELKSRTKFCYLLRGIGAGLITSNAQYC